ncbi:MAG: DUF2809 domain-containing protein [Chloroflexota bacterium]
MTLFQALIKNQRPIIWVTVGLVIGIGIASRAVPIGSIWWDKYLGDVLYTVLFYLLVIIIWPNSTRTQRFVTTCIGMILIELFQLTGISMALRHSGNLLLKIISITLGTTFSWYDLIAYGVGVLIIWLIDYYGFSRSPSALS